MIVTGAGIIGLACAWRLAQRGVPVTVFDARETASEASWAGAGMLAPGGEMEEESPLLAMALQSLKQYPDFVTELMQESGVSIDYQRNGALELAFDLSEAGILNDRAARQAAIGIRSEAATHPGCAAARFFPDDALVDPRDVTAALRIACLRAGVLLREHEPVIEILAGGKGVRTLQKNYYDAAVLVAAGAWSSSLLSLPCPVTTPVRGHLISYRADRQLLGGILRHLNTYLVQRQTGSIIAGASTEHVGFDRSIDERIVADIHCRAARMLPPLANIAPAERWNGFRPAIEGGIPAIGRMPGTTIWMAFGHYRNGILLAPETARIIAESVGSVV
jgi:glycine oxidase